MIVSHHTFSHGTQVNVHRFRTVSAPVRAGMGMILVGSRFLEKRSLPEISQKREDQLDEENKGHNTILEPL